jgi:hypothetical protein
MPSNLILLLALALSYSFSSSAQEQQPQCGTEADDLSNCVAAVGGEITSCLNCASEAVAAAATSSPSSCQQYNASFCASVAAGCAGRCDDGTCGQEFSAYVHCEGRAAYGGLNSTAAEGGGACEIECGDITGNATAGGSGNSTSGSGGDGGAGGVAGSACNSTWTNLERCLAGQGRSDQSQADCASCVGGSAPPSAANLSCLALDEQYCTAAAGCEGACARQACGDEFSQHVWCVGRSAGDCPGPSCGTDPNPAPTSGAAAPAAAHLSAFAGALLAALVAVVTWKSGLS